MFQNLSQKYPKILSFIIILNQLNFEMTNEIGHKGQHKSKEDIVQHKLT